MLPSDAQRTNELLICDRTSLLKHVEVRLTFLKNIMSFSSLRLTGEQVESLWLNLCEKALTIQEREALQALLTEASSRSAIGRVRASFSSFPWYRIAQASTPCFSFAVFRPVGRRSLVPRQNDPARRRCRTSYSCRFLVLGIVRFGREFARSGARAHHGH